MARSRDSRKTRKEARDSEKAPARRGRPVGDRDARRGELLRAAASVIAEEGYSAASLRKVAERAGCTTGAVTYYFASKEEMIVAVAEGLFDDFDAMLEIGGDGVDLRTILERWIDRTKDDDSKLWLVLFQLLAHARHEAAFAAVVQRRYARFRESFAAILARGQREGSVRKDIAADLLADQLSAISDGWLVMFPIEPERFRPKRVKALMDALLQMIAAPGTARKSKS